MMSKFARLISAASIYTFVRKCFAMYTGIQDGRKGEKPNNIGALNLWFVNQYAADYDMPSGTRHVELADQLAQRKWCTTIFATPFNYTSGRYERPVGVFKPFLRVESGADRKSVV